MTLSNKYEKKAKTKDDTMSKLLHFLSADKTNIIIALIFSILGAGALLAGPLVVKELSTIVLNGPTHYGTDAYSFNVMLYTIISAACYVVGAILQYVGSFIIVGVCSKSCQTLRNNMIKKINRLPMNYFDTRNIGDVLSYVTNDVDIIGTTLNQTLATAVSSVVTLLGVVIILFVLKWQVAIVALIVVPIALFVVSKIGVSSQKQFVTRQDMTAEVSADAEQAYTAYNIVKVFKATDSFRNKFAAQNSTLETCSSKADYLASSMHPVVSFFGYIMLAGVALVGGCIAANAAPELKNVEIATIVAAISYSNQIMSPLIQIATTLGTLQQTIASAKRVFSFIDEIDEPDESHKTATVSEVKGNIGFEHVKFGYTSERVIIHDFSEQGKAGQKIAIVGPTGAGKTTMVNLLMRFYDINSGKITIEGIDTQTMNRSYVRSLFGMVLQDTWLFEGTIMENLKYSRPDATDEEVYKACEATHCDTFIKQQPGGYNHVLNEDCGLSAGQKQLLTIARAMIQNAPMLILDEATSNIDTRTELLIQDAMDTLTKGRTSFVIAHRLSTIKNSDLIIVMRDGDVIETGNHDSLMKMNGFYAQLYNAQFSGNGPQFD